MPRASKTATKAEETEQAVNSTAETEKPQETAKTDKNRHPVRKVRPPVTGCLFLLFI